MNWSGTCGNCASTVGPFVIRNGWVPIHEGITTVRIFNTNTHKRIIAEVPVRHGEPVEIGDLGIAGVPGTGAPQRLWFVELSGSKTGALFSTGHRSETIDLDSGSYHTTLIDAGNPVVLVPVSELGLRGTETPVELNGFSDILHTLEELRAWSAVRMGLVDNPPVRLQRGRLPFLKLRSSAHRKAISTPIIDMSTLVALIWQHRCCRWDVHGTYPLTGAIATGIAAVFDGTVAKAVSHPMSESAGYSVKIGHPSGVIQVDIVLDGSGMNVDRVGVCRTARRLASGQGYPSVRAK